MAETSSCWTPDRVAIALGVAGSMAGNVAWAWPRDGSGSWVLVGVGVLMSLVLPAAVRLWRVTPAPEGGWLRLERAAVMGAICSGAALYSLVHTTLLLADVRPDGAGLPGLIAWVPPAVMELLVVQAARATQTRTASRHGTPNRDRSSGRGYTKRHRPASAQEPPSRAPERDAAPAVTPSRPAAVTPSGAPAAAGHGPAVTPRPVSVTPAVAPDQEDDMDPYAHLDEPAPPDETPEDRRKRLARNRQRRSRAAEKAAGQQEPSDTEEKAS